MERKTDSIGKKIFQIHVRGSRVVDDELSEMDSVAAVCGALVVPDNAPITKDTDILVYIDEYAAVGIMNLNTGEEMWHWDEEIILSRKSSMLLYVLADEFEWLIYKAQDSGSGFCLSTVPMKHPGDGRILDKVETLEHFKAFEALNATLLNFNMHKLKTHKFIFNQRWKCGMIR